MKKIVLTGGAGFIGAHVAHRLAERYSGTRLTIVDKLTYAADLSRIEPLLQRSRVQLVRADIVDEAAMGPIVAGAEMVVHLAAESHVDRSFADPLLFQKTNLMGTGVLLEAARLAGVRTFLHMSTDEVYGEHAAGEARRVPCGEEAPFAPTNPYAASKAAADTMARSYARAYRMDVRVLRPNNVFGLRQHTEKLIPAFSLAAGSGRPLPVHDGGHQRRTFLHVDDLCNALQFVLEHGERGGTYNAGGAQSLSVVDVAHLFQRSPHARPAGIVHVSNRPRNDSDYRINDARLRALGWRPSRLLAASIDELLLAYCEVSANRRRVA